MIDRDRATQIITDAIRGPNDIATDAAHELAAHIATALDVLGLLVVCSDPAHEQADVNDIVGQGTATHADIVAQQPNGSDPALWAGKRQRD